MARYYGKCDVVGCDKPAKAGTYCHMHYARMRRHNRLDKAPPINRGKVCSVEGCESPAKVRGMCGMHGARMDRWGDPAIKGRGPKTAPCIIEGCEEVEKCQGLCNKHYTNYTYHQKKNGEMYSIQQYAGERSTMTQSSGSTMYNIYCNVKPNYIEPVNTAEDYDKLTLTVTYTSPYTGTTKTKTGDAMYMFQPNSTFYSEVIMALNSIEEITKMTTRLMEGFLKEDWDEVNAKDPQLVEILQLVQIKSYGLEVNVTGPASQN